MKGKRRNDYSKFKRKVFARMLLIVVIAVAAAIMLRIAVKGYFGDGVVNFLMNSFDLNKNNADTIYRYSLRNNLEFILFFLIIAFLIGLFRLSISCFTKYFDEISAAMDRLVNESDEEIRLSPELEIMENKFNKIKDSLDKRSKALLEAEKRKNDWVVYLAHDIKTPLTSVISYLNLLDEAPDIPQEQRAKYVGITLEKAYRLEQLINEFFEITRFSLQTIVLNKGKINLPFMLRQMADEFYPMLTPKGKAVSVDVPDRLTLWGDADKLARVFGNILKNAIAYSRENSIIGISAEQQEEYIVITFTNQGSPIPLQKLNMIFEKFCRLDSSRSSNTGGAGLGLVIAKEIVTAHGGTITAESSREETVFTVTLPSTDVEIRKP